ncbi:MAG: hypothetical protein ACI8PZ_005926 [Myxococcota bacterium]|jgi:hypothetical protein
MRTLIILVLAALGCAGGDTKPDSGVGATDPASTTGACAYPDGVVDPMTLAGVIPPFSWPSARSMVDGSRTSLDLLATHCANAPDIEWSPFDVLLFVSIPAW